MTVNHSLKGLALISAANVAFCGMACLIRSANDINAYATSLFRFTVGIGIIGTLAMSGKMRLNFVNKRGLFARGLLGSISVFIGFISIIKLGIILASIIVYTYPIFATIFGTIFLRERVSVSRYFFISTALIGMAVLVVSGGSHCATRGFDPFYLILAIGGSVLAGLTVVLIKRLQETDSTASIFFAQCLVGFWGILIPASSTHLYCGIAGSILLLVIGVLATIGQLFSTEGLRYLSVSSGSLCTLSVPVLNVCAGALLFHESLSVWSIGGGAIVIVSSVLTMHGKDESDNIPTRR